MRVSAMRRCVLTSIVAMIVAGFLDPAMPSRADGPPGSLRWLFAFGSSTGGRQVSLRVTMWGVAPPGGAEIELSSSHPAIIDLPLTVVIPAGASEVRLSAATHAVTATTPVTVTARYRSTSRFNLITILRPHLSSTTVQTWVGSGRMAKITVRLRGIAPSGAVTIRLDSNRPSVLPVPDTIVIPVGTWHSTVLVPARAGLRTNVNVNISAMHRGLKITKPIVVRKVEAIVAPTPTATPTVEATATATDEPTATATVEPTATATDEPTATATDEPTATATDEPTATATDQPTATATTVPTATATATTVPTATPTSTVVQVALVVTANATSVRRGSTVYLQVCLVQSPQADVAISWAPSDSKYNHASNHGSTIVPAGVSGGALCLQVNFAGLNSGGGRPVGSARMIFTVSDGGVFNSPEIAWS